jgi:hypothetical protein
MRPSVWLVDDRLVKAIGHDALAVLALCLAAQPRRTGCTTSVRPSDVLTGPYSVDHSNVEEVEQAVLEGCR